MTLYTFLDGQGKTQSIDAYSPQAANDYAMSKGGSVKTPADTAYETRLANMNGETTQPLGAITTDGAAETLQKKVATLDTYSPTTAAGYVPPVQENKKDTTVQPPKAYFINDAGQEAEYTQEQLNNPDTQKFIKENGYAMTKTEGPTGLEGEVNVLDSQIGELISTFNNYNVNADPAFAAQADSIRGQYNELRDEVRKSQEIYSRSIGTSMKRYTPNDSAGLEFTIATEATKALGSILRKEQSTIAEARTAYQNGKYTQFNNLMANLEKIRSNKATRLKEISDKLTTALDKQKEKNKQATRDSAVSGLLAQGITDPKQILQYLNYDESGNQIGDFSSKEIADTLKNFTDGKTGWQDKLSGTTRDFYILKDQGQLPANITSLPEDQQLFAYLKAEKLSSSVGGKGNPLTLSEVLSLRKQGIDIPLSMVGHDQDSFNQTLTQEQPPQWFIDKAENELRMSLSPNAAKTAWDEYKKTNIDNLGIPEEKQSENYKKAKQYFSATYDGLSPEDLDKIATNVETYVNGGMSYADAVKQVIDDLK
jgi:hypothetical protein